MLNFNLIFLSSHAKSIEFADFISNITYCCKIQIGDLEFLEENYKINFTEFQNLVEEIYFQPQEFLEK